MWRRVCRGSAAFSTLVRRELANALRELDVHSPNTVQDEALRLALSGHDLLCVAQTGAGKTLVSLLPILERLASTPQAEALLLAPSSVLAAQHAATAKALAAGLPTPPAVVEAGADEALAGTTRRARLIVSTPTDFLKHAASLGLTRPSVVAIDEADALLCGPTPFDRRVSPAGATLLRALDSLFAARATGGVAAAPPQWILTTAMLTTQHEAALHDRFSPPPAGAPSGAPAGSPAGGGMHIVRQLAEGGRAAGALVPSLRQRFFYGPAARKDALLLRLLAEASEDEHMRGGAALVFCRGADEASRLANLIAGAELRPWTRPRALHDELTRLERDAALAEVHLACAHRMCTLLHVHTACAHPVCILHVHTACAHRMCMRTFRH